MTQVYSSLHAWLRSPFLYIAVISACRQSSGTSPVMSDCLNMMVKKGAISLHASLSIIVGIWSGPFAFVGSNFSSNVQTPFSVILRWSIDGTEEFVESVLGFPISEDAIILFVENLGFAFVVNNVLS